MNKEAGSIWPISKFQFSVSWGDVMKGIRFMEVEGLEVETQDITYRVSDDPRFSTVKMPGMVKYGAVTLKRGVFVNDHTFFDWYSHIKMNTIMRNTVIIKMLNEAGQTVVTWTLKNAWPTKITGADLESDNHEVTVETLEIAHEELTIQYHL